VIPTLKDLERLAQEFDQQADQLTAEIFARLPAPMKAHILNLAQKWGIENSLDRETYIAEVVGWIQGFMTRQKSFNYLSNIVIEVLGELITIPHPQLLEDDRTRRNVTYWSRLTTWADNFAGDPERLIFKRELNLPDFEAEKHDAVLIMATNQLINQGAKRVRS
jgi:hypothetical protein